jgi:hypothetical protein
MYRHVRFLFTKFLGSYCPGLTGIVTLTKHPADVVNATPPDPGAGAPEISTALIAAGILIYREWEREHGLDAHDAWSPTDTTVAEMISRFVQAFHTLGCRLH